MFEYKMDESGRFYPVLKPLGIAIGYLVIVLHAVSIGVGSALFGLSLSLLSTIVVTLSFLMCRPRPWMYGLPFVSFGLVFLMTKSPWLALFSVDFFLYGFLIVLCLRFRIKKLPSCLILSLAYALVAVFQFLATVEPFSFPKAWTELEGLVGELRTQFLMYFKALPVENVNVDPREAFDTVVKPLLPGVIICLFNIAGYFATSVAYMILGTFPEYKSALQGKVLKVSRVTAVLYVLLWLSGMFIPSGSIAANVVTNLVYILMLPFAAIGLHSLLERRKKAFGGWKTLYLVAIIILILLPLFMANGLYLSLLMFGLVGAIDSIIPFKK